MGNESWREGRSLMDFSLDLLPVSKSLVSLFLLCTWYLYGKFSNLLFCTTFMCKKFSHRKCGLNKFQVCLHILHPQFSHHLRQIVLHKCVACAFSFRMKFLEAIHQIIIQFSVAFSHRTIVFWNLFRNLIKIQLKCSFSAINTRRIQQQVWSIVRDSADKKLHTLRHHSTGKAMNGGSEATNLCSRDIYLSFALFAAEYAENNRLFVSRKFHYSIFGY